MQVKIVSGWSNPGGSTTAHISLTNLLNDNGYDCTFYGPHDYHLDKCKSGSLSDYHTTDNDVVVTHFIRFREPVRSKLHIFSCHEKDIWPIRKMQEEGKQDVSDYDAIHFVSEAQKKWQDIDHGNQVIIPPVVDKVNWTPPKGRVAGVIGSVDWNKQVHTSISRAINRFNYDKVLPSGIVTGKPQEE